MKKIIKRLIELMTYLTLSVSILIAVLFFSLSTPQIKDNITRYWMYNSVVYVSVPPHVALNYRGTGFHVKGKSGETYVLTVDHLCMHETDNTVLLTSDINFKKHVAQIIARDPANDLCLVTAYDSKAFIFPFKARWFSGEHVWAYGYPGTEYGLFSQFGELLIYRDAKINLQTSDEKLCKKGGGIYTPPLSFFMGDLLKGSCSKDQKNLIYSSYTSEPGLSGGPVINMFGQTIGMNIARTHKSNYGILVPATTIIKFLENY